MEKININHSLWLLVVIPLLLLALISTGCNISPNAYRTLNVKSELCHYNFEYSTYYRLDGPRTDVNKTIPSTDLILEAPVKNYKVEVLDPTSGKTQTIVGQSSPAAIYINVYDSRKSIIAPKDAEERLENDFIDSAKWKNFKLLERSPVTISDIEGEMIAYMVDKLMPIPAEDGKNLEYHRAIYFNYNGLIWVIEAKSDQDITKQVKADFEHILQTFKLLD